VRLVISVDRDGGAVAERQEVDGAVATNLVRDVGIAPLGVLDLPVHADAPYETVIRATIVTLENGLGGYVYRGPRPTRKGTS
jgi:hypothetical protein